MYKPINFSYLEKYGNRKIYKLPTLFDLMEFKPKQKFLVRLTRIYDPSKFWIVIKYKELEILQTLLFRFYYVNSKKYIMPKDKMNKEMYCVAYIAGAYYRGVILNLVCGLNEEVQVYFVDYGLIECVNAKHIYYMAEKYLRIPEFGVRASLANLSPISGGLWNVYDEIEFFNLVYDKVLACSIVSVCKEQQILSILLCDKDPLPSTIPIHQALINQKRACLASVAPDPPKGIHKFKFKHDCPYLLPSHKALECGKVPTCITDADYQLKMAGESALSAVIGRYYTKD